MTKLHDLLSAPSVVLDGAMGTLLIQSGLPTGNAPELWNFERPEVIQDIHRRYIAAGARIILTNSFGGSRTRLARHDLQDRVTELNRAAAANARLAAQETNLPVMVAGSIGPTGEMMHPLGSLTLEAAREVFAEQADALANGGADLIWIETMSDLAEVIAAIEGARSVCDLPIAATMSFDSKGRTMMGVTPEQAIEKLSTYNMALIGANCGRGPDELEETITRMMATHPTVPLIAKANAGLPKMVAGEVVYDGSPEVMAAYAQRVYDLGARLIGGCCGSTPDHIAAMSEILPH